MNSTFVLVVEIWGLINIASSPSVFLSNKNPCKDIIHIGANAEEYYHVELICNEDNGIEYVIQAYGEQAKELYKEINRFTTTPSRHPCIIYNRVSNKWIGYGYANSSQKRTSLIQYEISTWHDLNIE